MFCTLLLCEFKRFISASRTLIECKYKYKLLSPIKIKLCVSLLQFFILLRDVHCTTLWNTHPSPARLYQSFFYSVFQCRQSLCSVRSLL